MLLRLLLLRKLSPTLYRLKLAGLIAFAILFLAFVAECGYLLYHQLQRSSGYPPIHSPAPQHRMQKGSGK
jgi:uncharacterized iron-regulated membrane protein